MAQAKDKKKQTKKKMKPMIRLLNIVLIVVAGFLIFNVGKEVYTSMKLKKQIADAQLKLQKVQDENSYLKSEKEKLEDPDYVASYARGNYLLSKKDEQIFYLPEKSDK